MQEFENIQSIWQSHAVEIKVSSDQMLAQIKKELNGIRQKSLLNISGTLISFAAISLLLFFYDFNTWTTPVGIGLIMLAIAGSTVLLYRDHLLITHSDFTEHPAAFIEKLKIYQIRRYNLYNKLYWFYTAAITLGFGLYFFEMLDQLEPWIQVSLIAFTFAWMLFCATTLRKAYLKREKERLDLLIEKFSRITSQLQA